jgi:hypothetical protein
MNDEHSYKALPYFDAIVVLYLRPCIMQELDRMAPWYQEGRIIYSTNKLVVLWENGRQMQYDVEFRKRRNIHNTAYGMAAIKKHALEIGGRQINFYHPNKPKGKNFLFKVVL